MGSNTGFPIAQFKLFLIWQVNRIELINGHEIWLEWPLWFQLQRNIGMLTTSFTKQRQGPSCIGLALFFILWPGQLGCGHLLGVSGYILWREKRSIYANSCKFRDTNLGSHCGRWEWDGRPRESVLTATRFHGSKVILCFLLLAQGPSHFPVLVSWGVLSSLLRMDHRGGPLGPAPAGWLQVQRDISAQCRVHRHWRLLASGVTLGQLF